MPFENPQGAEFDGFNDCKSSLMDDGMSEADAERLCGSWEAWWQSQQDNAVTINSEDPTSSATLRESFISAYRKRWRDVRGQNREWLESRENFERNGIQGEYRRFFESYAQQTVLEPIPDRSMLRGQHWTGSWITQAYDKGLRMAREDLRSFDIDEAVVNAAGNRQHRDHQRRLKDEYEKIYYTTDDHISLAVSKVSDVLREATENNKSHNWAANETNRVIRSNIQTRYIDAAKTAIPRAVNEALLNTYVLAGVQEVGVAVEGRSGSVEVKENFIRTNAAGELQFETAGDAKVCPTCASLAGKTVKIEDVRDEPQFQPPVHPRCRCRLVPTEIEIKSEGETVGVPDSPPVLRSEPQL